MKIVGIFLLIVISGLAILAIFSNFLANDFLHEYFMYGALGFSLIILVFILFAILRDRSAYIEKMRNQGRSPFLGIIGMITMVPLFTLVASCQGLPIVLNYMYGVPGELMVTVQAKPAGYHNRRCSGKVMLKEYTSFLNDKVCGIEETDWRRLEPGSKLILFGKKSKFGIQYNEYKI